MMGYVNGKERKLDNPIPDAIKEYIAKNYGDGNCITSETGDNLGVACMTGTLKEPLPTGYTVEDICKEEVITWAYDNVGWCISAPPPSGVGYVHIATPTDASTGQSLSAVKIYVDGVYIHHYAPEDLTFGPGKYLDTYVSAEFGTHEIRLTKDGYNDWVEMVNVQDGSDITLTPSMTATTPEIPTIEVVAGLTGSITDWTAPDYAQLGQTITIEATCKGDEDISCKLKIRAAIGSQTAESDYVTVAAKGATTLSVQITAPATAGVYTLTLELLGQVQDIEPETLDTKTKQITISSVPPPENLVIEAPHNIPSRVELGETADFGIGITNYRTTSANIYVVLEEIHKTKPGVSFSQTSETVTITSGEHLQVPVSWHVAENTPLGIYEIYASLYEAGLGKLGKVRLGTGEINLSKLDLERVAKDAVTNFVKKMLGGV